MALNKEKQRHLTNLYTISQKYPGKKTAALLKLEDYGLTIDDFNQYDSLMVSQYIVEPDTVVDEYPTIPGFTQSDKYSDSEVLKIFEARDSVNSVLDNIGSPPTDAEWFQAGVTAEQRIAELRPFYETRKAEEWEELESPLPGLGALTAPLGFLTELFAGGADLRYDFKEDLHERGFGLPEWVPFIGTKGGSGNPFTGFGAWDIAEFKKNPRTGQTGLSPELLAIEDELEKLYGDKRGFTEKIEEGGYRESLPGSKTMIELDRLNTMITEEQLLDPRMFGEAQ